MLSDDEQLAEDSYWAGELERIAGSLALKEEEDVNASLLKSVTHLRLVMASSAANAKACGVHGVAFLCCGPGDDSCISQIHLRQTEGRPAWVLPHVEIALPNGAMVTRPVFKGRLAEEIGERVRDMYDAVKKQMGKAQYGKAYRFAGGKVTEEVADKS